MDLEKFVSETLVSIKKGLRSANEQLVEKGKTLGVDASADFIIGVDGAEHVEFDVAVTASEEVGKKGGAHIKVVALDVGGGVNKTETQQSVSRIKFKVQSSHITG